MITWLRTLMELLFLGLRVVAILYVLFPLRFRKVPKWLKHLFKITVNRKR